MKRNTIRLIILLGTLVIAGITLTQVYWVLQAFDQKEKEFNLTVNIALKNVAGNILDYNHNTSPLIDPVHQISPYYFAVSVNDKIDSTLLKGLLKNEFLKNGIKTNIDYYIYDCIGKKIEARGQLSFDSTNGPIPVNYTLPEWSYENYYFGIYFPQKNLHIIREMRIWFFSTSVIVCILVFFGYSLFVILKQKKLSEIQKDFINNMTHEFKTPITTIAISAEVLKDPAIINNPDRLRSYAVIIEDEALRLKTQVDRVLQMSVIDKVEINLKKEKLDIHEVLKKVADNIRLSSGSADIQFNLQAGNPILSADRLHITNIIYNLLDNAMKYSEREPRIILSTEDSKNKLLIQIQDFGKGIKAEDQKKIFDKFYRVSQGNIHDIKGFGLGLFYVKKLALAHKGEIRIQSEINKGTTFALFLPYE
jgi:two-component system, OmpR family, phosphate regulon sensor histidine kinase PhoR